MSFQTREVVALARDERKQDAATVCDRLTVSTDVVIFFCCVYASQSSPTLRRLSTRTCSDTPSRRFVGNSLSRGENYKRERFRFGTNQRITIQDGRPCPRNEIGSYITRRLSARNESEIESQGGSLLGTHWKSHYHMYLACSTSRKLKCICVLTAYQSVVPAPIATWICPFDSPRVYTYTCTRTRSTELLHVIKHLRVRVCGWLWKLVVWGGVLEEGGEGGSEGVRE